MIASLPMYDRPELAAAHDAFWAGIRDTLREAGIAAPEALDRGGDLWETWRSPDLLLGQTCGLPYRTRLHDRVTLVATPDFGLDDTPPGHYRSVFVTRRGDAEDLAAYADRVLAVNEALSHSGWAAPWRAAMERGFSFRRPVFSGSHRGSAMLVADGGADIAALDAATWRNLTRFEPDLAARLHVIGHSAASPGLPYITALGRDPRPVRRALQRGLAALEDGHREALGLRRIVEIASETYLAEPVPPAPDAPRPE